MPTDGWRLEHVFPLNTLLTCMMVLYKMPDKQWRPGQGFIAIATIVNALHVSNKHIACGRGQLHLRKLN